MPRFAAADVNTFPGLRAALRVAVAAVVLVGLVPAAADAQAQRRAKEFELANGMQVVVVPDHRAPVVTHVVWYRVGGADNAPAGARGDRRHQPPLIGVCVDQ